MFELELEPQGGSGISAQKVKPNQVKTSVEGLGIGMFVTKLDSPWVESTFPPQGFRIESHEQIELIKNSSRYVYIDTTRGESPDYHYWILEKDHLTLNTSTTPLFEKKETSDEYTKLKKCFYEITTDLGLEMETAKGLKKKVSNDVKRILNDLQSGKSLDIETVKQGVTAIVESILRNPAAFNLLTQLKSKDGYSYSHALGTSVWCAQFGRHLGLRKEDVNQLALGGMLLDIGKVKIPSEILNKESGFTDDDLKVIRSHVDHSVRAAAKTGGISKEVLRMIATHHERADGSGYPEGLSNEKIPIFGRIAGIVDSYDAMTSVKPHNRHAMTPHDAINELYNSSNTLFQPELIEQFIQTVGLYPTGSLVEFETGQVGVVVAVHDMKRLYPTIMLLLDSKKQPLAEFLTIDLAAGEGDGMRVANGLAHGAYGIKMDELFL